MRKIAKLSISSIIVVTIVFVGEKLLRNTVPEPHQVVMVSQHPNTAVLDTQKKLDKLSSAVARYQQQLQQALRQQSQLKKVVANLDAKLMTLGAIADESEDKHLAYVAVANDSKESSERRSISDAELGKWIEERIDLEGLDETAAARASYEAMNSLDNISGVNLDEMRCGAGICRATFSHESGQSPDIFELIGAPPFTNEVSMVEGDDGSVLVYFTERGISLDSLRAEALQVLGSVTDL